MNNDKFNNFLKITEFYKLKQTPRVSSNHYYDEKDSIFYKRRETTSEHVQSCIKLADYFLLMEPEFLKLDNLKVLRLLSYHDDVEIETKDVGIAEIEKRINKEKEEFAAILILAKKVPKGMDYILKKYDAEFRSGITEESKFALTIDKLDSLVHEFAYPKDWGPKGFDEMFTRKLFQKPFEYSPTFKDYFETMMTYLRKNKYFEK